jgi:hypothetical protein
MACVMSKPIVDGIEKDYAGTVRVLRIDARNADNSAIAAQFGLRMTPTYIIFDQQATEQYRSTGSLNRGQFDGFVAGLLGK